MVIVDFIRKKYQQRLLRRLQEQPREKCIHSWENVKQIGLIFTVGDAGLWNLIHRFITAQQNQGKEVHIIGYHRSGYEINYIFSHTQTTICHEKDDLNFFRVPKDGVIEQFNDRHYDLLIDASEPDSFFGQYITALNTADLKVGYHLGNTTPTHPSTLYDMVIEGNDEMDFKEYIEQIVKYLTMVKK